MIVSMSPCVRRCIFRTARVRLDVANIYDHIMPHIVKILTVSLSTGLMDDFVFVYGGPFVCPLLF